jgi:methionyl-tRNA formyltransferase
MTNTVEENILFLGDKESPLFEWLKSIGELVIQTSEKISPEFINTNNVGFLVSYGYRHILKQNVLELFPGRAINLHISYLPWNKGADPNFWSFMEDTPKGVTIHYLDEGVDTGDIIVQEKVNFNTGQETLASSYEKLQTTIQKLFKENWHDIKSGKCKRQKQAGKGSLHKVKDKDALSHLLTDGWNTPLSVLEEYAAETQMSQQFWEKYDFEIEEIRKQNKA